MGTGKIIVLYLLTIPVFFVIDMVWLGIIARGFYRRNLAGFLSDTVNWPAAIIFYLLFIIGILLFASIPALARNSLWHALLFGALFGFFTYATYDLTNLATLKDWPLSVVVVDILWGMFLSGAVAVSAFLIGRWIGVTK
jgi:uncharacterized membrane protein